MAIAVDSAAVDHGFLFLFVSHPRNGKVRKLNGVLANNMYDCSLLTEVN